MSGVEAWLSRARELEARMASDDDGWEALQERLDDLVTQVPRLAAGATPAERRVLLQRVAGLRGAVEARRDAVSHRLGGLGSQRRSARGYGQLATRHVGQRLRRRA